MSERERFSGSDSDQAPTIAGINSDRVTETLPSHPRVLVAPLHYEPRYSYPLLVWLHGEEGEGERQLLEVMPQLDLQYYVAVAPRGVGSNEDFGSNWPQTEEGIVQAASCVFHAMTSAEKRFRIARDKVFIAGHQSGGTMAIRLAWRYPDLFAGAVSLCGPIPRTHRPLAQFAKIRRLPVLLTIGRDCDCYGPCQAAEDLKFLHAAGINVMLRQYPGCSELSGYMLADVNRWMMEIVAGTQIVR